MADRKVASAAPGGEVNPHGELTVPLDGVDYGLRPDFEAIAVIEQQLRPIEQLAAEANVGTLTFMDMAVIVQQLMRGYGRAHPDDERIQTYRESATQRLGELIYEAGLPRVRARLFIILAGATTGGYTAKGEAKAPASKRAAPAGA